MVHRAPLSYSGKWLTAGWRITKAQYPVSLWLGLWFGLSLMLLPMALQSLGVPMWVFQVLPGLMLAALGPGILLTIEQISRGEKPGYGKLFAFFTDKGIVRRYWPVLSVNLLVGLLNTYIVLYYPTGALLYICSSAVILITVILTYTTLQIILAQTAVMPAAKNSVSAILKNLVPLIFFALWIACFAVPLVIVLSLAIFATVRMGVTSSTNASYVSAGVMLIPMALLIMPILLSAQYAVYTSLFEGLHPDEILAKSGTTA